MTNHFPCCSAYDLRNEHRNPITRTSPKASYTLGIGTAKEALSTRPRKAISTLAIHKKRGTVKRSRRRDCSFATPHLISIGRTSCRRDLSRRTQYSTQIARPRTPRHNGRQDPLHGVLFDQGRFAEAAPRAAEALEFFKKTGGSEKGGVLEAISDYQQGLLLQNFGVDKVAEGSFRSAVIGLRKNVGKDHVYNSLTMTELAVCLARQKKNNEAEEIFRESIDIVRKSIGLGHPRSRVLVEAYANLLAAQNRVADGRGHHERDARCAGRTLRQSFRWRIRTLSVVGQFNASNKQIDKAEEIADEVTKLLEKRESSFDKARHHRSWGVRQTARRRR